VSYRRFFLIRLAQALFALWLVATLVFVMFFVLLPEPERNLFGGDRATPAMVAHTTREFHLRASLPEQYARYMWRLVTDQSAGRPGYTYGSDAYGVSQRHGLADSGVLAREAIGPTLAVVIPTLLLSLGVGALAGGLSARRRWRRIYGAPIYVAVGLVPAAVGLYVSYYLGVKWGVIPIGNYCNLFESPYHVACSGPVQWAKHLILPVVTLSLFFAAVYTRMVRAGISRAGPDRAERRSVVLFMTRVAAFDFGALIGLSLFVEAAFQIPGLGRAALTSYFGEDLVLMQAVVLYGALLGIAATFIVDAIVGALDEDVRHEWRFVARPKRAA
jgi:peptide/nickel transport system permease protein